MFTIVLANLWSEKLAKVVLVAQAEFGLGDAVARLRLSTGIDVELVEIDYVTRGAADTVELAAPYLDEDGVLITANSDQYVDASIGSFVSATEEPGVAGCILTMGDDDSKWSYVSLDGAGHVTRVVEKQVISPFATVGIYGFHSARRAFEAFAEMRAAGDNVNGEYYVAPAYNRIIAAGEVVTTCHLGPINDFMHGMGIPHDYEQFLRHPASRRAAARAVEVFGARSAGSS